jgi:uncharacterized protein (TIGR03790 family)
MKRSFPCALIAVTMIWCMSSAAYAQTSYDDVAVIVNTNSSASQTIGSYFKSHRGIPDRNIIAVSCSTAEEIDSTEFNLLRSQVESYLQANNLVDVINYLVTTKGLPLKINRGDTWSSNSPSASVESELMCILGSYAGNIGGNGRNYSPYYGKTANFSRASQGIYLVTRLDAYTTDEVLGLIDRSGPATPISSNSRYILDEDPVWDTSAPYLNDYLSAARSILAGRGKAVELNSDSVYVTSREGVVGYVSWGSNDHYADDYTTHGVPSNSWANGAIVETYVSTSGRSFENPPSYGQSLIADLIEEGVSGAKGYVYEPYSSAMANASVLFERYTSGYNLAESYFMASRYLSWMDVVVGDPKTTIMEVQGALPVQMHYLNAVIPQGTGTVQLTWGTISELNNYGFTVQRADTSIRGYKDIEDSFVAGHGTTAVPQAYTWTDHHVAPGAYYYRLKQVDLDGSVHISERQLVVVSSTVASVENEEIPGGFALAQNYPNPFNPATTIRYSVGVVNLPAGQAGGRSSVVSSHVRLTVYDMIGREVAVLVNEPQAPGSYTVTWNAAGVASGTYFYRLQMGDRTETRKMSYLK